MPKYIIGVDEGTTSCRAGLFDVDKNEFVKIEQESLSIYSPHEGYVEQDGDEIFNTFISVVEKVLNCQEAKNGEILGLGITNQRESTICFDKKTGKCLSKVIGWQCRRTAKMCDEIPAHFKKYIKKTTGLVVDAYFSATKMKWLIENNSELNLYRQQKNLCFSTLDSFLIFRLTKGKKFITDVTNASRTMLFDIKKLDYDDKLLKYFEIYREELPSVISNNQIIDEIELCGRKIKLCGLIGDQQSSLFGQACFECGKIKNTYGTGCFMLANTGEKIVDVKNLVSTVAYKLNGEKVKYALEGSVFNAGSCIEWLKDVGLIQSASETQELAEKAKDSGRVVFVPALTGLGAPYWDMNARGLLIGINRATKKEHIVRAVLESIAYSTFDVFNLFKKNISNISQIKCDGGVSKNDFLMQYQSDLLNLEIVIPQNYETTLLGAVYMCALGIGVFSSTETIKNVWKKKKSFIPTIDVQTQKRRLARWHKAISRSLNWRSDEKEKN